MTTGGVCRSLHRTTRHGGAIHARKAIKVRADDLIVVVGRSVVVRVIVVVACPTNNSSDKIQFLNRTAFVVCIALVGCCVVRSHLTNCWAVRHGKSSSSPLPPPPPPPPSSSSSRLAPRSLLLPLGVPSLSSWALTNGGRQRGRTWRVVVGEGLSSSPILTTTRRGPRRTASRQRRQRGRT